MDQLYLNYNWPLCAKFLNYSSNIALDPLIFFQIYTQDQSVNSDEKKYTTYPISVTLDELELKFPEIYKIGFTDKLHIKNIKITKLKLNILNNKLKLQNDDGYTLNDIAYLAKLYFNLYFNFNQYYKENAEVTISLTAKGNKLKVDIETDLNFED